MSTQIKEIIGRKESKILGNYTYVDSTLNVVRFFGGKINGRMLQLTINNDEGHSYIQLTQEQTKELAKTLLESFDDNIYPSE
jgi:hypothetical protein